MVYGIGGSRLQRASSAHHPSKDHFHHFHRPNPNSRRGQSEHIPQQFFDKLVPTLTYTSFDLVSFMYFTKKERKMKIAAS
jgi:hypothetical protein